LLGADQEPGGRRRQARRGQPLDRGALLPAPLRFLPQRAPVDDGPGAASVGGDRGERLAGARHGPHPVSVDLPEPFARTATTSRSARTAPATCWSKTSAT